jgi:hypothetical protein
MYYIIYLSFFFVCIYDMIYQGYCYEVLHFRMKCKTILRSIYSYHIIHTYKRYMLYVYVYIYCMAERPEGIRARQCVLGEVCNNLSLSLALSLSLSLYVICNM